jgi:nucleoside 2-deoxyribosyltransferase
MPRADAIVLRGKVLALRRLISLRRTPLMQANAIMIYCAGPLFNSAERRHMWEIASTLESAGYGTFLPQRDGLELVPCIEALTARGFDSQRAGELLSRAIFALDVFQVIRNCQGIVVNLNGPVTDDGTIAEAALAWRSGKALVGYKDDVRTPFGGQDNPLVAGLFDFRLYRSIDQIVPAMNDALRECRTEEHRIRQRLDRLDPYLTLGQQLWDMMNTTKDVGELAKLIGTTFSDASRYDR